ncbi:MAG TPA: flavin reductase family protein [Casimicrobiaceae bacterium]|nr:flavin reductase family protein [Casimicrobiaceae bacterium]
MIAELDSRRFRDALGRFATGVTIITTVSAEGQPVGLTANSFNSVSLTPPLILWSLNRRSKSLAAFEKSTHYAVNVLCAEQIALAGRFASPVEDRFEGVEWRRGKAGMPLFDGCVAWFECSSLSKHEGGDHVIFLGQVEDFGHGDHLPLLYSAGNYSVPAPHPHAKR